MMIKSEILKIGSQNPIELIDITPQVQTLVERQPLKNGLVVVTSLHTTAAVSINEKCGRLHEDFVRFAASLADPKARYAHNHEAIDGRSNAHSHLLKYFMSTSETIVLENGQLNLGAWQRIFFVELDGPRKSRQVNVTIIGVES
ncbi:MAG: YjbQ family protein [Deltaproteobacteria bacterium]|nr:YjbQ family protein [Deltaproteobacteria bacterium]